MLIVAALTNESMEELFFPFNFTPPGAELNITDVNHTISGYLDLTIHSSNFSLINVTISEIGYRLQGVVVPIGNDPFSPDYTLIKSDDTVTVTSRFKWQNYVGQNVTITVVTNEGAEATWTGTI
jgi:hypothetical protein